MGFFKTLFTGYKIMFQELNTKHNDLIPRALAGSGTGLMMIGSAVMAKTAMKEDIQQVIAEANAAVDESKAKREGEKKPERTKRIFKAKAMKGLKIVKAFHKGIIFEAVGGALVGAGLGVSEHGKHTAIKAAGAIGASFASYRAAVRDDLGEEADLRYLTGRKSVKKTEKIDKKTGEVTEELEYIQDDDEFSFQKDPDAFKFLFNRDTCPSLWSDNLDMRKANLEWTEEILTRKLQSSETRTTWGHVSLNEMRREFGGLVPSNMDVGIGGIYGVVQKPDIPKMQQKIDLGWRKDKDFEQGIKDWCWIIFPCDTEPIVNRLSKKKFKQVEPV